MNKLSWVFNKAKVKAITRMDKFGNTATPWKDFTPGWLKNRLAQEFREWEETRDVEELLDIINLAAFVYLSAYDKGRKTNVGSLPQ